MGNTDFNQNYPNGFFPDEIWGQPTKIFPEMGLKDQFTEDIKQKIINHRNNFVQIFSRRYFELLPELITYRYDEKFKDKINIDFLKMEIGLRMGYAMIVGECSDGVIRLMGWTQQFINTNQNNFFYNFGVPLKKAAINFLIPKQLQPKNCQQITRYNDGNFIVVYNKPVTFNSDYIIIGHYLEEIAEIVASRFSISMQIKIATIFKGEPNSVDVAKIANDLYNGAPYVQVSKFFDEDNILKIDNSSLANSLVELKREYQNRLSELNNILGINSNGVEKNSGVSSDEVNSNNGYVVSNANIYMEARKQVFEVLNRKYNVDITPIFNDSIASQLRLIATVEEGGNLINGKENDNSNGLLSK